MRAGSLSSGAARVAVALDGERIWVVLVAAATATIVAGYVSKGVFLVVAALLLVVFGYVTFRAPRTILALLVFIPLVDRYLIRTFVADPYQTVAMFVSEGLLAFVVAAAFVRGRREGRLVEGFRHPVTALFAAFIVVALLSTLLNGVRPVVAGLGIETTLDMFIVFYLARILGFDLRAGILALGIFTGIAVAAGLLAMAQVVLAPDILGLVTFAGRFGEGLRPGAIVHRRAEHACSGPRPGNPASRHSPRRSRASVAACVRSGSPRYSFCSLPSSSRSRGAPGWPSASPWS